MRGAGGFREAFSKKCRALWTVIYGHLGDLGQFARSGYGHSGDLGQFARSGYGHLGDLGQFARRCYGHSGDLGQFARSGYGHSGDWGLFARRCYGHSGVLGQFARSGYGHLGDSGQFARGPWANDAKSKECPRPPVRMSHICLQLQVRVWRINGGCRATSDGNAWGMVEPAVLGWCYFTALRSNTI